MTEIAPPAATRDRSLSLFRVAGIQIRLDPTWFLIFALLLFALSTGYFPGRAPEAGAFAHWTAGLIATLLLFASILVHELAHSLVAKAHGIDVPEIRLFLFGGVSRMAEDPDSPKKEFQVAIVGPLMSFAVAALSGGIAWLLPESPWMPDAIFGYLGWINLALGVFNLLPGFPLDGGRVLRALVWWRTGSLREGMKAATDAGKALAFTLILLGALQILLGALLPGFWMILIGLVLRSMAKNGYQELILRRALEDEPLEQVMVPRDQVVSVAPDTTLDVLVDDYVLAHGFRGFPVLEGDRPVGVIGVDEVRAVPKERWAETTVRDAMVPLSDELVLKGDETLLDALQRLSPTRRRLLVLRDGALVGLVSSTSLTRFVELRGLKDGE